MSGWATIAVAGLVSFGLRSAVWLLGRGQPLNPLVDRVASVLAPAVLAAIVAGTVRGALVSGAATPGALLPHLAALTVGVVVAVRTGSMGRTLAAGLLTYLLLHQLIGSA